MTFGSLQFNINNTQNSSIENFYCELNLENAVSSLAYKIGDVNYSKEYFVSHKDDVLIMKFKASMVEQICRGL